MNVSKIRDDNETVAAFIIDEKTSRRTDIHDFDGLLNTIVSCYWDNSYMFIEQVTRETREVVVARGH
jgi:hypothetical protein